MILHPPLITTGPRISASNRGYQKKSAVIGLVGAGGIGMVLDTALNLFFWDCVSVILFSIFVVVILAELLETNIRKRDI